MSNNTKKLQWDETALIPDSIDITFPKEVTAGGKPEVVTQWELERADLIAFVSEALDRSFTEEVEEKIDGIKQKTTKRIPFSKIVTSQEELLFRYLAKSSKGVKDEEFYRSLKTGVRGLTSIVDMFLKLNHIDEIVASGGNWLSLPEISRIVLEAETVESGSQKPTLQA